VGTLVLGILLLSPGIASADFTFTTGTVSSSDGNLSAEAVFQLSKDAITVIVTNLQSGIVSVGQTVSGISFSVDAPPATSFTLQSIAGVLVDVDTNGTATYPDQGKVTTYSGSALPDGRWHLTDTPPNLIALGGGQPDHLVLGPANSSGNYSSAKGSLNGQFNPFFQNSVTLVLSAPGVTDKSTISNVVFNFGTGVKEHTAPGGPGTTSLTPEPSTMALALSGFVGFGLAGVRRLRRREVAGV